MGEWRGLVSTLTDNRPNFSSRLRASVSSCSPVVFGSMCALTIATTRVILCWRNQPSFIFSETTRPRMRSAMMSLTSVRKQTFSRSSVGSTLASTLCTRSCRYNASFSSCVDRTDVSYLAAFGTAVRAGCGFSAS